MFTLPALPYSYAALAPTISEITMRTHHGRHHAKYVETVNALITSSGQPVGPLEDVVRSAAASGDRKLFNNAGQAWNHAFFWICMTPHPGVPSASLVEAINKTFGDLATLREHFLNEGVGHFGSGWVWLTAQGDELAVMSTHDGDSALLGTRTPLLVCDLWEHAYYLDHKNDRAGFLAAWWDQLVNWPFVEAQYAAAGGAGPAWRFADAEAVQPAGA